jgi:hypothetical protein
VDEAQGAQALTCEDWDAWVSASGCPHCNVVVMHGAHVCEHGVATAPAIELSMTMTVEAEAWRAWARLLYGDAT